MFHTVVKCPTCGHEHDFFLFKFNAAYVCEKCKKKVYVETKPLALIVLLLVFFTLKDYILTFYYTTLPSLPSLAYYILLFLTLCFSYLFIQIVVVKLVGYRFLFNIRNEDYYKRPLQTTKKKKKK